MIDIAAVFLNLFYFGLGATLSIKDTMSLNIKSLSIFPVLLIVHLFTLDRIVTAAAKFLGRKNVRIDEDTKLIARYEMASFMCIYILLIIEVLF